jgi:hypothetical protein
MESLPFAEEFDLYVQAKANLVLTSMAVKI